MPKSLLAVIKNYIKSKQNLEFTDRGCDQGRIYKKLNESWHLENNV